jgi:prenylcysteine alpha-carboxyl methylesterase
MVLRQCSEYRQNIPYDDDNPAALLDLYLPAKKAISTSATLHPIIVFIYGGSWSSGSKQMYTTMANTLRELGYAIVVPDYRKYPEVKAEMMYQDVRKTIRWAFTHAHEFNGDTEQIHVMVNFERHTQNLVRYCRASNISC